MYKDEYKRWLSEVTQPDLHSELEGIAQDEEQIEDRFLLNLEFGTAGLRGVLGAGTNRMNIYTVGKATQGLANFLKGQSDTPSIAISFDSRHKSDLFAQTAACVLAASGVKVYLYKTLSPVPMLSYAVRKCGCDGGIMITASHNPAKYNGYKVYGSDGCQMTSENADKVLAQINSLDIFRDIKTVDFDVAVGDGRIEYIPQNITDSYYDYVLNCMMRKDIFKKESLKVVYTPLNGAGNVPVRTVLKRAGLSDVTVVKEQEQPDGSFSTCPYPNPEIKQAMQLGLDRLKELGGDILIATDPDADRVGIAVREGEDYIMLSGNQVGILLLDYIAKTRKELGTLPQRPVAVKSIVTSSLADEVAKSHGVEMVNVLTGFKYIGEAIKNLEINGEENRFILGFEESYGYLVGTQVRDKDAVVATLLIAEMAAYYTSVGSSINKAMESIYKQFGYYLNKVDSYEFEGMSGMHRMKEIMDNLRREPLATLGGYTVEAREDYSTLEKIYCDTQVKEKINLPKANILVYWLAGGHQVIIRPSGTEPKVKVYYSIKGENLIETQIIKEKISRDITPIMA
ncbi:MAG: phospho-sugar mutase [Oscillospiraceae bacterium]